MNIFQSSRCGRIGPEKRKSRNNLRNVKYIDDFKKKISKNTSLFGEKLRISFKFTRRRRGERDKSSSSLFRLEHHNLC